MAKRWRREPRETGLSGVCQSVRGYQLRDNGKIVVWLAPFMTADRVQHGWYWYGLGQNTSRKPVVTIEEAKKQVKDFMRENGL